jgi:hypothetical protein
MPAYDHPRLRLEKHKKHFGGPKAAVEFVPRLERAAEVRLRGSDQLLAREETANFFVDLKAE